MSQAMAKSRRSKGRHPWILPSILRAAAAAATEDEEEEEEEACLR
jgi:hypothetical protein